MKFNIIGYRTIDIFFHSDLRGNFQKIYNKKLFDDLKINFDIKESYISISQKNSLRGMHFQKEPYAHDKLVACLKGSALDVCVDLRKDSKSYRKVENRIIKPGLKSVFIPKGVAHGFYSLENDTVLVYYTSSIYNPDADSGVLWNSIDFEWPNTNPLISDRDLMHPKLEELYD